MPRKTKSGASIYDEFQGKLAHLKAIMPDVGHDIKPSIQHLPTASYVLNYATGTYLFVSDSVQTMFGLPASIYYEKGSAQTLSMMHPDDRRVFTNDYFGNFIQYCRKIPDEKLGQQCFSVNYRVKKEHVGYIKILQQYVIIQRDEHKNPFIVMGTCMDISEHKVDNKIIFSVMEHSPSGGRRMVFSEAYPTESHRFSSRELEVAKLLVKGFTSVDIGKILTISPNTVKNHRQNLMKKTKAKNSAELSNYMSGAGLL